MEEKFEVNDCHVHVGKISGINSQLNTGDIDNFRTKNNINNILLLASDSNPEESNKMVEFVAENVPYVSGLYWYVNGQNRIKLTRKMLGIKYHGAYINKPVTDMNRDILEGLEKYGGLLMVHCGRYLEGDVSSNTSYKHALLVAADYPELKVILAHMGGTDTKVCKEALQVGKRLNNVYFDTSGITTPYIIEYALTLIPSNRILFGSDAPWCSFNSQIWNVLDANISVTDKKMILHQSFGMLIGGIQWQRLNLEGKK